MAEQKQPDFSRIMLKLSGEALMGERQYGLDPAMITRVAENLVAVTARGHQICLVIGGGNIFRGMAGAANGMERTTADYMGMLATVMNALAMQSALEDLGQNCRVLSAIPMATVCEPYIRRRAARHMEKGRVVIFAAGTGNPYFTTDTAAALRASEMNCSIMCKATKVDGVYDCDPVKNDNARHFDQISYQEAISRDLKVMDTAAITLCRDNVIPILVFSIKEQNALLKVIEGQARHTLVH